MRRLAVALLVALLAAGCAKRESAEAPAATSTVSVAPPEPAPAQAIVSKAAAEPVEEAAGVDELLGALDGAPAGRAAPAAPPPPPAPSRSRVVNRPAALADGLLDAEDVPAPKRKAKKARVIVDDEEEGEAEKEEAEPATAGERRRADDGEGGEGRFGAKADKADKDAKGAKGARDARDAAALARQIAPAEDQTVAPDRFAEMLSGLDERDRDGRVVELAPEDPQRYVEPTRTLPRSFYFENTYLGGNAAYAERLRRLDAALGALPRPYRRASLPGQPFDAPADAGLVLTAALDETHVDRPQRVHLQIGLHGSRRYGWRRPPLDVVLVADAPALGADGETLTRAVTELLRRLGPQDRLGVVLAGEPPRVLAAPAAVRDLRAVLARRIEALGPTPDGGPAALAAALGEAGALLDRAAGGQARIPGSGTVIVLTAAADPARVAAATGAAHALTVQGATTSVIALTPGWWPVAHAGHGNDHLATPETLGDAIDAELGSISRVIARLLRVNIRLAPGVEAIRILGSRALDADEVRQVKAREEATDRNLSKTMGLEADRGADDDGIQTVIPYFYGGDSHVILVELWVTRPGPIAEVTLKYKDMVALDNATARAAVHLDRVPRPRGPVERRVAANVRGFRLAEGLAAAARRPDTGSMLDALDGLEALAAGADAALLRGFEALVRQRGADPTVAEALRMARDRRIGHFER